MIDAHVHLEKGPLDKEYVRRFVDCAYEKGIDVLYIQDHSHRFREFLPIYDIYRFIPAQDEWLNARFRSDLQEYRKLITECRKEEYPIKVLFGLEICYQDCIKDVLKDILKDLEFDFLIGSVHAVDKRIYDCAFSKEILWDKYSVNDIYDLFFKEEYSLIESGLFTQIGHPDQIKMMNVYPQYDLKPYYEKLVDLALKQDISVENNTGIHYRYHHKDIGLDPEFLRILKEKGCRIITASDAHSPEDTGSCIDML